LILKEFNKKTNINMKRILEYEDFKKIDENADFNVVLESESTLYTTFLETLDTVVVEEGKLNEADKESIKKALASKLTSLKEKTVNTIKNIKERSVAQIAKMKAAGQADKAKQVKIKTDENIAKIKSSAEITASKLKEQAAKAAANAK